MMSSRGMGAISPSKMPKGKKEARRDDTDFTEYKKGGLAKQAATAIAMKEAGKKPKKMAAGGSASSRADGCAVKGKTKGRMLKNGGKAC